MNSSFQQALKTIAFKTFYHNQVATFDYDDLFAGRRVVIFSITQFRTLCSSEYLQNYINKYDSFLEHGVDDVYAIDSTDWLIAPMIEKKSKTLRGLPDRDMKFVESLASHYNYQKSTEELARFWQYIVIINNGEPEYLWHNPFKDDAALVILKDNRYRYRKLSADVVLQYLVDNPR